MHPDHLTGPGGKPGHLTIHPAAAALEVPREADAAELADLLSALAFDLEAGRLTAGDADALTSLTLAADDLLSLAAELAPDPGPYLVARAAVGALPTGADAIRPMLTTWPASAQPAELAAAA